MFVFFVEFLFRANSYACPHFPVDLFCYLLIFLMPEIGEKKLRSEGQRAQIVALRGQNLSKWPISAQMRYVQQDCRASSDCEVSAG